MDDEEKKTSDKPEGKPGLLSKLKSKKGMTFAIAALSGLSVAAVIGAKEGYDHMFKRYERPDYSVTVGAYCIERYSGLERSVRTFDSDGVKLSGYYYPCSGQKGLVVLCHGIKAGADDYLPMAEYFVKNGYAVFSFNYKGTFESGGENAVGMCESLVDLDHALDYIGASHEFKDMPLFLVGHSWGGYAVSSVLALHKDVNAAACISAPNNGYTLFLEKGEQYAGKLGSQGLPEMFLNTYQKILFGKYTEYSGVRGINSVKAPVLVAHGNKDKVIDINRQSIIAHKPEIINPNVTYYISSGERDGHDTIWHSPRAIAYAAEVDAKIKQLKKSDADHDEIASYVATVDHALYSEVDPDLFGTIIEMFDDTL